MVIYKVYYEGQKIGTLEVENGKHRYTPDEEGVLIKKNELSVFPELFNKTEWREPIPLFQNRIDDAKRFGIEDEIRNQTDGFCLKMVEKRVS